MKMCFLDVQGKVDIIEIGASETIIRAANVIGDRVFQTNQSKYPASKIFLVFILPIFLEGQITTTK